MRIDLGPPHLAMPRRCRSAEPHRPYRARGAIVRMAIRKHCHYEIHRTANGTVILVRPLSGLAQRYMARHHLGELQITCADEQATAQIRELEAKIDTALPKQR